PADGGTLAMYNLSQSLASQGHEVKILALNTLKHFTDPASLPEHFKNQTQLEAIKTDTTVKPVAAFLNLFSNQSYNITRFYNPAFEARLAELLKTEKFDIIQVESLFMMNYLPCIRKNSSA